MDIFTQNVALSTREKWIYKLQIWLVSFRKKTKLVYHFTVKGAWFFNRMFF